MLCVETRPVDVASLPTSGFYFSSPASAGAKLVLAGAGEAWSYHGSPSLGKVGAAWYLVSSNAAITDPLNRRGTGLIAFASVGFAPDTSPVLTVPRFVFGTDSRGAWLTVAYQAAAPDPALAAELTVEALAWRDTPVPDAPLRVKPLEDTGQIAFEDNVAAAIAAIDAGRCEKIVMARRVIYELAKPLTPSQTAATLARKLEQKYPSCWIFSMGNLVGATPEMLLEAQDCAAHARVLAGTASPGEDIDLLHSAKNLHEHQVALTSVTAPLEALTTVKTSGPYVLELPNLQHLASDVCLPVPPGKTLLYLLDAIHPTAAVCGLPREAAAEFIGRHEPSRGRYAGPVGWVDAHAGGQLALALRLGEVSRDTISLWAGAGIMSDSDPHTEFLETEAKLAAVRSCLKF